MVSSNASKPLAEIVVLEQLDRSEVNALLDAYGADLVHVALASSIPGSYWGDCEAGLIGRRLYARSDTPAHSFLHEFCHYVCMDSDRRAALSTDAGGSDEEECAVCYLQVLLADRFAAFGRARCLRDMDTWGYSFREGSAQKWFSGDGANARTWLSVHGLIDSHDQPTFRLRE